VWFVVVSRGLRESFKTILNHHVSLPGVPYFMKLPLSKMLQAPTLIAGLIVGLLSLDQYLQFLLYRTATPQALDLVLSKLPNEAKGSDIRPEFEVSGQLPAEIQLKIWDTAVSDPQVICVNQ
jgi:hypothetical protein